MSLFVTICYYFSPDRINSREFQDIKKSVTDTHSDTQTEWLTETGLERLASLKILSCQIGGRFFLCKILTSLHPFWHLSLIFLCFFLILSPSLREAFIEKKRKKVWSFAKLGGGITVTIVSYVLGIVLRLYLWNLVGRLLYIWEYTITIVSYVLCIRYGI